ncbi:MAG TPA: MBL fold metallo-hydrolase [Candidatus Saccharimonadales bacterium]|nr:MBL fold metallo-hydrolase [Candidatus Saccharimonadales bacterium]
MKLTFLGATREVTGSNTLFETSGKKILFECGLFQGIKLAEERNYAPFAYDPKTIDFLLIGHAHLDHVGRIPKLVKEGFRGRIFSTAPSKEIARLVLEDSFKLMREEANREDKPLLYYEEDITASMNLFETIGFDEELEITNGIKITFKNSGHILGSASIVVKSENKTLFYSSDIGNSPSVLLDDHQTVESADYVICESTYGGRVHEDIGRRSEKLGEIINATIEKNGVLIIPTFAIERTQELLSDIEHFCKNASCALPTFYLDSPLGQKVTEVFQKYPQFLKKEIQSVNLQEFLGLSRVKMTATSEQSKEIEFAQNPKIIMAGSGMMNGGRILFHLQNYIEDPNNTLLIVGYQAQGTLGRRLLEGEEEIKIFGKSYQVGAKVMAIGSYSAHADAPQLLKWLQSIKNVKKVFLVHGESSQMMDLAKSVEEKLNLETAMPQQGEEYEL